MSTFANTSLRRLLALLLVCLTLLVTGCSAGQNASQNQSSSADSEASSQETKTVETAFGPVDIPRSPERIVALEGAIGPLLHAGKTPVATADANKVDSLLEEEAQAVQDLPLILGSDGWDYEKIAAENPDLLIGFVRSGKGQTISDQAKQEYERLSKIAPTVFILSKGGASTKEATLQISEILGDAEAAKESKEKYEAKAAAIKEKYATVLEKNTFAALDYFEGTTTVYTPVSWIGGILTDAGAHLAQPAAGVSDTNGVDLSSEELSQLKGATVILTEKTVAGEAGLGAQELAQVPTYQSLAPVKEGHAYGVSYFFADRYETGLLVLNQLEEILQSLS